MFRRLSLLASVLLLLAPGVASAAACCMSASVVGVGRLKIWEDGAGGLTTGWSHGTGRWSSTGTFKPFSAGLLEDELRVEAWAMVRLHEAWQLSARVPWVVGIRAAGETSSVGTGPGDVGAAIRWEPVPIGAWENLPGIAFSLGVTGPTGRRPEQATDALGASSTGRGVWSASLAVALEYAWLPWFVRLDAGFVYNAPFLRTDLGVWQTFGPGVQAAFSGGRELFGDKLVLAGSLRFEHEFPLTLYGQTVAQSDINALSLALSAAWNLTPHWTATLALSSDVLGRLGVGMNREERWGATLGVRHGFF
ncbi:MAG: hypothetical protein ACOZQL_27490 [Myxococcota bacterium]